MLISKKSWIWAAGLCIAVSAPAQSQQRTSATYDDWTVACVDNQKLCEITASQQLQGQSAAASQITISGIKDKSPKLSIQIPPNVWLTGGIKLAELKGSDIVAAFRWCVPNRCLADVELKPDAIRKLGDEQTGSLVFQDASRRDQKIPVSFKGLGPALESVLKHP